MLTNPPESSSRELEIPKPPPIIDRLTALRNIPGVGNKPEALLRAECKWSPAREADAIAKGEISAQVLRALDL